MTLTLQSWRRFAGSFLHIQHALHTYNWDAINHSRGIIAPTTAKWRPLTCRSAASADIGLTVCMYSSAVVYLSALWYVVGRRGTQACRTRGRDTSSTGPLSDLRYMLVPLPAAIPSSDETGRYAWISRSAGFCRTGSGWPAGRTLQWARPQPTEPHVVRHTYNLRRHETVDLILNSRYLGHARLMITLPTELWSNNLENKLGYNMDFLHYIII